jgi:hypothetical protein
MGHLNLHSIRILYP